MKLYTYFRSSASWRVRIALAIKGIPYEPVSVNLLKGEHRDAVHVARNPLGTVPLLEVPSANGGAPLRIGESLAIIQYLDETHPSPPLLPGDAAHRARIRWLAELVNAGIHPLQNLSTLQLLEQRHHADADGKKAWAQHWIARGFAAMETRLVEGAGTCCVGDDVTLADVCLVPQVYNARRYAVDLAPYPTLVRIADGLAATPPFHSTHPDRQPDTPPA